MGCTNEVPVIYKGAGEICEIETKAVSDSASGIPFADIVSAQVIFKTNGNAVGTWTTADGDITEGSTDTSIKWIITPEQSAAFVEGEVIAFVEIVVKNDDFPDDEQPIRFSFLFCTVKNFA